MCGWVEYHPSTKLWSYLIKFQITQQDSGDDHSSEAEAVLALKRVIEILARGDSNTIRSVE
jgi:hypothetical protein